MPLYEYKCLQCERHTEKIQKFSDPEITVCPHCGGTLERVITAPAISFKGGGWYADGYGNAKPAAADATTKPAADAAGSTPAAPASGSAPAAAAAPVSAPAAAPAAASSSSDKK
jgi:putative FmdB family regulatory protein